MAVAVIAACVPPSVALTLRLNACCLAPNEPSSAVLLVPPLRLKMPETSLAVGP